MKTTGLLKYSNVSASMILWIKRVLISIFSVGLSGLLYFCVYNWEFVHRLATYPRKTEVTAVDWYSPIEVIPGKESEFFSVAPEAEMPFSKELIEQVESYIWPRNTTAFLILHRGRIVFEKYAAKFSAEKTTNSMSMAKTLLSLLIGIAIDEGKIKSEEDAIGNYIAEWQNDARGKITIKNLLQMSSGLKFNNSTTNIFSDLVRMHLGKNVEKFILSTHMVSQSGEYFEYNNVNAQILALLLERATGVRYASYLSQKLWQPLGAGDAGMWLDKVGGSAKAYCCFFAKPRDWARVGQMLLQKGEVQGKAIVSKDWFNKMLVPSKTEPEYGYMIWLGNAQGTYSIQKKYRAQNFAAEDLFLLTGQGKQHVVIMPSQELVFVRLGESPADWDDAFLANTFAQNMQKSLTDAKSEELKTDKNDGNEATTTSSEP